MHEDHEARAEELLSNCLDKPDPEAAMRDACEKHPELASTLHRVFERMRSFGLLEGAAPMEAKPLPEIPGFTLLEKLGEGGMGVVYHAWQSSPHREVAIKIVRPELLHFEGQRARFEREIETVATLSHPNIVPILEVGEAAGVPWFSMEFIRGAPLSSILSELRQREARASQLNGGDLEEILSRVASNADAQASASSSSSPRLFRAGWIDACLSILEDVASALIHAHERGVLHRDIKPSNIMVTLDGRVQLLDFGLARKNDERGLTRSTAELGSLPYLAPEVLRGSAVPTEQLDVYGIGVTMYEALSLVSPFLGRTPHATRASVIEAHPRPLRRHNPNVPWDVETVCSTAMAPEREQRYPDMLSFHAELGRLRDRLPIQSSRAGSLLRLRRWQQRHPAISVGMVTALLLATLAGFVLFSQSQSAKRELNAAFVESEQQREIAERALHASRLALVQTALTSRNFKMALTNLERCDEDRRGWTWKHLRLRARSAQREFRVLDKPARLELSRDGSWLVMAARDGALAVIDTSSGAVVRRMSTEATPRSRVDIAPAGDKFVLDEKNALVVRTLPGAKLLHRIPVDQREYDAQFAPDGRSLWTIDVSGLVRKRALPDGRVLRSWSLTDFPEKTYFGLRVEKTRGERIACFTRKSRDILIYDAEGTLRSKCSTERGGVDDVRFYRGGRHLASISTIYTQPGSLLETFEAAKGRRERLAVISTGPRHIDVSPDGRHFAVAGKGLFIITSDSLTEVETLNGHVGETDSCAFGPAGQVWSCGSEQGVLCAWDLNDISYVSTIPAHSASICALAVSPNSRRIASAATKASVEVHDVATRKKLASRVLTGGRVDGLDFESDERIATGSADGKLRILDAKTLADVRTVDVGQPIRALHRKEGAYLVRTDHDALVLRDDGTRHAFDCGDLAVTAAAVSNEPLDRAWIALGLEGGILRLTRGDGSQVWNTTLEAKVVDLDFHADSKTIAAVTDDKKVWLLNREDGRLLRSWANHLMRPSRIRFGVATDEFYTTSWGGEFRFWDARYEESLGLTILPSMLLALEPSPDGRFLATAGIQRTIQILWATKER